MAATIRRPFEQRPLRQAILVLRPVSSRNTRLPIFSGWATTKAAIDEATRDGAAPIDLVDGDQLADKLKELALGIKTELVEKVSVDPDWFINL